MKNLIKGILLWLFFLFLLNIDLTYAQKKYGPGLDPNLIGLKIGDTVSDVVLKRIRNYPTRTAKLSDFKGRLIILDFWSKGCTSCLSNLAKMDKVQEEFADKIQILFVGRDPEKEVKHLFKKSPNLKNTKLPVLIGDTILHNLFPHTGVPYHVWINDKRVVVATTSGISTTSGNIKKYLKNGDLSNVALRNDLVDEKIRSLPIIEQLFATNLSKQILSYSLITKRNLIDPQSTRKYITDSIGRNIGMRIMNSRIIGMYKSAYSISDNERIIVNVKNDKNILKYFPPEDADQKAIWLLNNLYCYELLLPNAEIFNKNSTTILRQDLDRYLMISSSIEMRPTNCIILYSTKNKNNLKSKGGPGILQPNKDGVTVIRNRPFSTIPTLVKRGQNAVLGSAAPVVLDETGINYSEWIDADIDFNSPLSELQKTLEKYGLVLKQETREIRCLILTEL